jgi:HK97 family phage portal protein
MGWLQRQVRKVAKRAAKYAGIPLRDPALVAMLGNQPTASGVDVDENTALNYSAVWAAVNVIASNVAALPPIPYEIRDGGHYEAVDTPAHTLLLNSPNDEMTPYVFHETLTAHALVWGNGYAETDKVSPEDTAREANILMPNQTEPMRDEATGEVYYQFTALYAAEEDRRIPWWKVVHIPGLGFDGMKGYPVIQQARESIGLGVAAEKFGGAFFGRGCTLGGILEAPEELEMTDRARKNLRESFELLHRGPDNSHRIAILEQGMKYLPISIPPEDAQFLETRIFQIVEVARWFNIPPHLLRDLSHATFSNIEQQGIEFFAITLRPWLIRWAQEYRRKLFGGTRQNRFIVCHDPHNIQMMETNSRYAAYAAGRNGGWLTLNNILKREGQNPLPAEIGDARLAPSTMKVLGRHGEPVNPDDVKKAMDLLSAMKTIDPVSAKSVLVAMVPGIAGDALDALVNGLAGYTQEKPLAPTND